MSDELLFTPSSVLAFLSEIDELKDAELSLQETNEGIIITVNDSNYTIDTKNAAVVTVDESAVDEVSQANEDGYEELAADDIAFEDSAVEGGIIKELAKTLLLGGLVRLTSKALKNT